MTGEEKEISKIEKKEEAILEKIQPLNSELSQLRKQKSDIIDRFSRKKVKELLKKGMSNFSENDWVWLLNQDNGRCHYMFQNKVFAKLGLTNSGTYDPDTDQIILSIWKESLEDSNGYLSVGRVREVSKNVRMLFPYIIPIALYEKAVAIELVDSELCAGGTFFLLLKKKGRRIVSNISRGTEGQTLMVEWGPIQDTLQYFYEHYM